MRWPRFATLRRTQILYVIGFVTSYMGVVSDRLMLIYLGLGLCVPLLLGCCFALAHRERFSLGKLGFFAIWLAVTGPMLLGNWSSGNWRINPLLVVLGPFCLLLPIIPEQQRRRPPIPIPPRPRAVRLTEHPLWDREHDGF